MSCVFVASSRPSFSCPHRPPATFLAPFPASFSRFFSLSLAGTTTTASESKKGYKLPRACMTNADVTRLINSDEVQSVVSAPKEGGAKHYALKKNPLKNLGAMIKLNPQAATARRCVSYDVTCYVTRYVTCSTPAQ